jgi:N-acetylglutamate synthase-like GNAT family acetyltransferase
VNVRKADLKDIKEVLAVINISNAEAYKKIIPQKYFKEPVFTYDEFLEKFGEMIFYVYEQNGEIAGAAALQTESEGLGYVRFVYVLPKHQRKGIGTRLVTHIEIEARRLGLKTLKVPHVDTNAYWAINFYMKLGYKLIDKHKKPWGYDFFFKKML